MPTQESVSNRGRPLTRYLTTLIVALLLAACQSLTLRTWELPPGVKAIQVNGYEMAYLERGSGAPIVLIHGTTADYRYLTSVMDVLAARHRVLSISLRHHYPERWDGKGEYSLPLLAADVAGFIRKLNLGPVHLVGHSYGGTVAFLVARDSPDLVRSLVSMEGMGMASNIAPALTAEQSASEAAYAARRDARFQSGDVEGALREFVARIGGNWDNVPEPVKQTVRDNAWTLYAGAKAGPVEIACADLRRLPMRVLVVQGDKTTPHFAKTSDNLAQCLTRVERATIAGAGHVAPRSHPAEFSKLVLDFASRQ